MAGTQTIKVTLQRDSLQTPWGFRLQGGADFRSPFTINKVFDHKYDLSRVIFDCSSRSLLEVLRMVFFIVVMLFLKSIIDQLAQCFILKHLNWSNVSGAK